MSVDIENRPIPEIPAEAINWKPSGYGLDPRAHLLAPIVVAGVTLHLEAIAIHESDGCQMADDPSLQINLDDLFNAVSAEGHWQLWYVGARAYVLFASPHC